IASKPSASLNAVVRKSLANAVTDHVSGAANCVQQRHSEALVDLRTQTRDMDVDDVGLRIEMIIPDILKKHGARHDLPRMPHQILEQTKLARLQGNIASGAGNGVRKAVELKIADAINGFGGGGRTASAQRFHACEQFGECIRFGEIVV